MESVCSNDDNSGVADVICLIEFSRYNPRVDGFSRKRAIVKALNRFGIYVRPTEQHDTGQAWMVVVQYSWRAALT